MTPAQIPLSFLFQHPEIHLRARDYFRDITHAVDSDLVELYRLVWDNHHLPVKHVKVIRPAGNARIQELHTPDKCWVVGTKALSVLKAPETVIIRQEYFDCLLT